MSQAKAKGEARAVADVTAGMLLASVEIAAPPERVFRALTSEEIVHWWGSAETFRTTKWTGDVRVGGAWRSEGVGADGQPFSVDGEYLELEPPTLLVQRWRPSWDGDHTTTVTFRLEPIPEGTRVILRHEGFLGRPDACRRRSQGWERVLTWLQQYAARS